LVEDAVAEDGSETGVEGIGASLWEDPVSGAVPLLSLR
jgi:hypothetical protein